MTEPQRKMLRLLSSVLHGEVSEEKLSAADKTEILSLACRYGILYLLYDAVCTGEDPHQPTLKTFVRHSAVRSAAQSFALEQICAEAERTGTNVLLLKGASIRSYYPQPEKREMWDIDLFAASEQLEKTSALLRSLGYKAGEICMHHRKWRHPQTGVCVELHHTLGDEADYLKPFFTQVFERAVPVDGFTYVYQMREADLYVHTVYHLRHHLQNGNWQFRQLADIFLLETATKRNAAEPALHELGLMPFAESLSAVTAQLFAGIEPTDANHRRLTECFLENEKITFSPCAPSEKTKSMGKGILRGLFPNPNIVYLTFPKIHRHKWLLPIGYLLRPLALFFYGRSHIKEKWNTLGKTAAASRMKSDEAFLNAVGINIRISKNYYY